MATQQVVEEKTHRGSKHATLTVLIDEKGNKTYPCPECGKVFDTPGGRAGHMTSHGEPAQCPECGRKMPARSMPNHRRMKHGVLVTPMTPAEHDERRRTRARVEEEESGERPEAAAMRAEIRALLDPFLVRKQALIDARMEHVEAMEAINAQVRELDRLIRVVAPETMEARKNGSRTEKEPSVAPWRVTAVLDYMKKRAEEDPEGAVTPGEVAKELGFARSTAESVIRVLRQRGELRLVGQGPTGKGRLHKLVRS